MPVVPVWVFVVCSSVKFKLYHRYENSVLVALLLHCGLCCVAVAVCTVGAGLFSAESSPDSVMLNR